MSTPVQYKQLAKELARELEDTVDALHFQIFPAIPLKQCTALNCRRRQKLLNKREVKALLKEKK